MLDILNNIWNFFNDIASFVNAVFIQIEAWIVVWKLKLMKMSIEHAWAVADVVLENLNISSYINTAWQNVDSTLLQLATFFRIPEALNIILNAYATRLVMRFLGMGGL